MKKKIKKNQKTPQKLKKSPYKKKSPKKKTLKKYNYSKIRHSKPYILDGQR